jgi:TolB-like protein/Tfp pilus assembly protein PilF
MSLLGELKRRNVFRVGAAYVVIAWLLLQVVDVIVPILALPDWVPRLILLLIAVGFIPAVVFAWAFEWTPEGLKRERDVDRQVSITRQTGRKLNRVIIFVLVLVIALMAAERMWLMQSSVPERVAGPDPAAATSAPVAAAALPLGRSIAVLPFENRSATGENSRFFSDGIHDDLLTLLSKIHELKVISRTSVMRYRNSDKNMRQIAEELGVSTLLEGGVQQAGNRVRINVQLINAQNDAHLWAETYDREVNVENIFDIQAEIARAIALALEAELTPEEEVSLERAPTASLEAYQAVLKSRQLEENSNFDALEAAIDEARKAISLDGEYADAYLALANALISAINTGAVTVQEAEAEIVFALDTAMALSADHASAHALLGYYRFTIGNPGWEQSFQRALELNPVDSEARYSYGLALQANGRPESALPLLLKAREQDPYSTRVLFALGRTYQALEMFDESVRSFVRLQEIDPDSILGYAPLSGVYMQLGQLDRATYWMNKAVRIDPDVYELSAWMVFLYECLEDHAKAALWSEWLEDRVTKQPHPIAIQAMRHYLNGRFEMALQMSNLALNMGLPDRWGSEPIFMRIKRDEALSRGAPEPAIDLFRQHYPGLFDSPPVVTADNLQQAADLALLLKLAGRPDEFQALTNAALEFYDKSFAIISGPRLWLKQVKAELLALQDSQEMALAELRRIIDAGWRFNWRWETEINYNFNGIRETPAFQSMIQEISEDMAEQSARTQAMTERGEILPPPPAEKPTVEGLLKDL